MTYRLAASAEMLFLDLPFAEPVQRLAELGFEVEIWNWTSKESMRWRAPVPSSRP